MRSFHRQKRRGTAAIEFAFWVPMVALMFSGIVDLSWLMTLKENVTQAARDGARAGAASNNPSQVTSRASTSANGVLAGVGLVGCTVNPTEFTVSISGTDLDGIRVDVSCPFHPLVGLIPMAQNGDPVHSRFTLLREFQ